MEYTLVDVSKAIGSCRPTSFNWLRCIVVNYTAENDFPHKFVYNGCSNRRSNGTYCAKANCEHLRRVTKKMFRFQLQVTDSSSSPPVTVTIFDSVHILMRMSAEEFCSRSPEAQLALVKEKTSRGELCDIDLRVKQDAYTGEFMALVQMISIVENEEDQVVKDIIRTPTRSTSISRSVGEFHTPQNSEYASGSRRTGNRNVKLSDVKMKMQDLNLAVIDFTEADD